MVYSNDILAFVKSTPWALDGDIQLGLEVSIQNEAARLKKISGKIKFSLLCPMYNTDPRHLRELLWSCQAQSWDNWEIILVDDGSPKRAHLAVAEEFSTVDLRIKFIQNSKNGGISAGRNAGLKYATGDYIGILDHDDLLHPQALGVFGREILEGKNADTFIFSNECKITDDSRQLNSFFYKPGFCKSTLLRSNYIAHLTFVERTMLLESNWAPDIWYRSEYDGAEDHEFFLRLSDHPRFKARHIPLFTYLWRQAPTSTSTSMSAKPYVFERAKKMIAEYLDRKSVPFREIFPSLVKKGNRFYGVQLGPLDKKPVPLVIVPFRDASELTLRCLESLELQTVKSEVILANNGSSSETITKIHSWIQKSPRVCTYKIENFEGAFDYAYMNNKCVEKYGEQHEYLSFINNDMELSTTTAFEQMIAELDFNPKIAFIGIRLYYPGEIETQHGGIRFGLSSTVAGRMKPMHIQSTEEFASDQHVATAITFAAAMCRKAVWSKLGGLETHWLPNGLGDVDICLRASAAGYQNFYLGSVEGIHHESKTRSPVAEDLELWKLYERNGTEILRSQIARLSYDAFQYHHVLNLGKPLRYVIADKINDNLKRIFRPIHSIAKRLIANQ